MSPNPPQPYRVDFLQDARQALLQCEERATTVALRRELAASLRNVLEHLARDPQSWGDPYQTLVAARLYRRIYDRVLVEYAVHQEARLVWVKTFRPVFDHPLKPD